MKFLCFLLIIYSFIKECGKWFFLSYEFSKSGFDTYMLIGRIIGFMFSMLTILLCFDIISFLKKKNK